MNPPEPADKQDADRAEPPSPAVRLRAQEKEFRETTEQLFLRVGYLRTEFEHVPAAQVFSVSVFKETQEIEKPRQTPEELRKSVSAESRNGVSEEGDLYVKRSRRIGARRKKRGGSKPAPVREIQVTRARRCRSQWQRRRPG